MGFFEAVSSVFSQYFGFSGRALRSEYWYFMLFSILIGVVVGILDVIIFGSFMGNGPLSFILSLVFFFPTIAVAARRLHDSGRSGWWQLLPITIIGIPFFLYWVIRKGDQSENKFGIPPIGSKSNHSSAARAARSSEPIPSEPIPSESRAARAARSPEPIPSESRAARAARSPAASSKNSPDEPAKTDSSQENSPKDISSEADDLYFDNRRKK